MCYYTTDLKEIIKGDRPPKPCESCESEPGSWWSKDGAWWLCDYCKIDYDGE